MKKVSVSLQTIKDTRDVIKNYICKDKKKKECGFLKMVCTNSTKRISCNMCPIKCLDKKLKESITQGEK